MDEETARKIRKLLEGQRQINLGLESGRYKIPKRGHFDEGREFAAELFRVPLGITYVVDTTNH
ncbi:MAG: hypothetical protein KJ600_04795 [Nanoarchaeota archaeon]|nr:hypothetical protein [Nanoarchaeota archaeon]MBU1103847.1 hypothetical protein [Nanoarchaeota archaeon]